MDTISVKLRKGQGPLWGALKSLARGVLTCHVPVSTLTRPMFAMLYTLHVLGREGIAWGLRFFWYEPLFRSQCASVGDGFRMEKLPYIVGHGRITIGRRVRLSGKSSFGFGNRLGRNPAISIGDGSFVGHDCGFGIADSITIGQRCLIAGGVSVRDFDGHPIDARHRREHRPTPPDGIRPVVIGDDVWIGAGAMILKGVTIGDRAVVGAGAVVSRDVPPDAVVAGNPARVVRELQAGAAA
jgi:acetyltransferase-like isoleucine patch superfamily enzyme